MFKYLVEKHQELETINIGVYSAENEDEIVPTVFSHLNLRSITIFDVSRDILHCLSIPGTLLILEKLEKLKLGRCLSNNGLIEILRRSKSNLRELDLFGSSITGIGLEEGVNSFSNLEILNLAYCQKLTNEGLVEILRISENKLRVLDLSNTRITGSGLGVNSLPNLETLNLAYCRKLTSEGLIEILRISGNNLRVLNLSRTRIVGIGLEKGVNSLPNLERLNLSCCDKLTDGGVVEILKISGSKLRYLDVSVSNITGIGLEKRLISLPNLETLNLSCCDKLTNNRLAKVLRISGSKLRLVNLSRTRITGIGFEEGVKSLSNLETLDLSYCDELIDRGLVEIIRISKNKLRVLNVSRTRIIGIGLEEVLSFLPCLETLDLSYCDELKDGGLRISGSKLKIINVSKTRMIRIGLKDRVTSFLMLGWFYIDTGLLEILRILRILRILKILRILRILRIAGNRLKTMIVAYRSRIFTAVKETLYIFITCLLVFWFFGLFESN